MIAKFVNNLLNLNKKKNGKLRSIGFIARQL